MKLFLKRSKGSITVLVTLILVPTIFFTGFMVDLARLKLYGNQAVMTADNYGETVLSMYDNLLKELYGLFAVTQDEQALNKLNELQEYVKSSFNPSDKAISWEYLQAVLGTTSYDGFMPYKTANVSLNHEFVENANLRNEEVFSTQIGDFMKFRIAQQLLGDGSELLEAISEVQNMEGNSKAIDKKLDMDKKAEEIYQAAQEFYTVLKDFVQYPDYIKGIDKVYSDCGISFGTIVDSDSYKTYYDYITSDQEAMEAAVEKRDKMEADEEEENSEEDTSADGDSGEETDAGESETLSEEEQALIDIYDAYMEDSNARRDVLEGKFDAAIQKITDSKDKDPINFDNFDTRLTELANKAKKVKEKGDDLQNLKTQLQNLLNGEDISVDLKNGIQQDLDRMNDLFDQMDDYTGIADFIKDNDTSVNTSYEQQVSDIIERLGEIKDARLDCKEDEEIPDWLESLDQSKWKDFQSVEAYKKLYDSLVKCFGDDSANEQGNKKKNEAEDLSKKAKKQLDDDAENTAEGVRDIPDSFGYGSNLAGGSFDLSKMVKEAAGYFSMNSFKEAANKLILKLYTVEYDLGMFSSRITNVKKDSDEEEKEEGKKEVSLTGYEKAANINYLYQAELEYILGGANKSKDNLNAARNKILAFRAIVNFTATYSVKEINETIQAISDAAAAVNPILGLAVNGALRLAVAGIETARDWEELKKGEGVVLIKTELEDLTAYDEIMALLDKGGSKGSSDKLKLDYNQYLTVMLIFLTTSDEIANRTMNLIELNVNTVRQEKGSSGTLSELEFKMADAHTAVNATCTVHLDFAVMPKNFAKSVAKEEDYNSLMEIEKRSYKFTVTRGY